MIQCDFCDERIKGKLIATQIQNKERFLCESCYLILENSREDISSFMTHTFDIISAMMLCIALMIILNKTLFNTITNLLLVVVYFLVQKKISNKIEKSLFFTFSFLFILGGKLFFSSLIGYFVNILIKTPLLYIPE